MVIMKTSDYEQKIHDFLTLSNAQVFNFNFKEHNNNVRKAISESKYVITSESMRKALKQMCASVPKLCGQIKIQKTGLPIRPVVAFYSDPTYLLAKFLGQWFIQRVEFKPNCTIKDSVQLASSIQGHLFSRSTILVSFDIVSMYTKIPVPFTIDLMVKMLYDRGCDKDTIQDFQKLITISLKHNLCAFRNQVFLFPDGLCIRRLS